MDRKTRIVIADDQELFALGLQVVIESGASELEVTGIARDGLEAVAMVKKYRPDIVLMDVRMPRMDGVEATRVIHAEFPDVKILILTTFDDDEYVQQSLRFGAIGYLLKDRPANELVDSVRALGKGILQIDPAVSHKVLSFSDDAGDDHGDFDHDIETLTSREREVLAEMMKARRIVQISRELGIADQTVRNHISNIYSKLRIHDRLELVRHVHRIRGYLSKYES